MKCEGPQGRMNCDKCKYNHCYYGCMRDLFEGRGFVQVATKTSLNFVQIDNKKILDK